MAPRKAAEKSLAGEVRSGDRRRALEAVRDRLAEEMERAEGAAVAALAKQLGDVLGQLDAMKTPEKSAVDQISKQRDKRRAAAQVSGEAGGRRVVGGTGSGRAGRQRRPDP